jgi:hypothetical protein
MNDLLAPLFELARPLIDLLVEALPFILAALLVVGLLAYGYTRLHNAALRLRQRRRDYKATGGESSWKKPRSLFALHPVEYLIIKGKILANEGIIELYAPAAKFIRDLKEKEKARKDAWRSPFPDAVKATIAETPVSAGKKLDARKQIKKAAAQVQVQDLPKGIYVGPPTKKNDDHVDVSELSDKQIQKRERAMERQRIADERHKRENHFRIDLGYVGKDPAVIEKVEGRLVTQLGLKKIRRFKGGDTAHLSFIAHREEVIDPLEQEPILVKFLDDNPATDPMSVPLAMKQDGTPWMWGVHHTLILGTSGSGKGSPLQAAIHQLAPFVAKGVVQFYGIDPKRSEFKMYADHPTSLFKRISLGMSDEGMETHAETISILKAIVDKRSEENETSVDEDNVEDGRTFVATREKPLIIFLVDEYPTLKEGFDQLGPRGKKPQSELRQVISTGRSLGVYLMTATQDGEKSTIDAIKKNISRWLLLRQNSEYMNDKVFLYDGAAADGFDSTAIPASGEDDGYKTAGLGYVKDEAMGAIKIRFPFISKHDMARTVRWFQAHDAEQRQSKAKPQRSIGTGNDQADGGFSITDQDEEDSNELPNLELIDFDEIEEELPPLR